MTNQRSETIDIANATGRDKKRFFKAYERSARQLNGPFLGMGFSPEWLTRSTAGAFCR